MALLAMLVLSFCTSSEAQSSFIIKIVPPEPTSADEVSIEVKVTHSGFGQVSFSKLRFISGSKAFLAIIFEKPVVCLARASFENLALSESTHTYQLGQLEPGRYEFQLHYCLYSCLPLPDLADGTEQCQLVGSQEFQVAEASIERITDQNGNGYIDDDEILWAINLWIAGAAVPGTSQTIDDATILSLIDLWIKQSKV